jgi:ABC-type transport system involved in cytochrome c biogenesis ATPase subunit
LVSGILIISRATFLPADPFQFSENSALLQLKQVACERDDQLLFAPISMTVKAGQIVQLEGPNGVGKTSLLRSICGLSSRYRGEMLWRSQPLAKMRAGQQRRVALARLFLADVPLWILDEPFTAIDKHGVAELESWLAAHAKNGGAVLLTTHQPLSMDVLIKVELSPADDTEFDFAATDREAIYDR